MADISVPAGPVPGDVKDEAKLSPEIQRDFLEGLRIGLGREEIVIPTDTKPSPKGGHTPESR